MRGTRVEFARRGLSADVGPYRLLASLGTGGMGRVSLARAPDGRLAALKQVHPALAHDPGFRERFRHEVLASRRVSGAYTPPVLDADPDAPEPWLASLYIAGPTLQEAVDAAGPLPEDVVRRLAVGLVTALADIHRAGLIHRDLKPSNVLLAADGPRVIDFGIARASEGDSELTRSGAIIGSPGYLSPEQAQGQRLTPASDVFSLGGLLVLAATGRAPFTGRSTPQTLYNVVHLEPDLAAVPPAIRYLAEPCLAKDPLRRPSPSQLLDAVGALAPSPRPWPDAVHALITGREKAASRALRGRRGKIAAAVVGAAAVVAGAVTVSVLLAQSTPQAAPPAEAPVPRPTTPPPPPPPPAPLSVAGLRHIDPCKVLAGLDVRNRMGFTGCAFVSGGQHEVSVGVPSVPIPAAEATETATVAGMPALVRAESDRVRDRCRATVALPDDPESALSVDVARDDAAGATAELCEDAKAKLGEAVLAITGGSARLPDENTTLGKVDACALLTDLEAQPIFGVLPTDRFSSTSHSCTWYVADSASVSVQLDYYDSPPNADETRGERITIGGMTAYQRSFTETEPDVCELRWLQHGTEGQPREVASIRVRPPAEGNPVDTCRQAREVADKVVPRLPR
ncbi:serine/threonine-protein kinase [Amycolatopsis sp. 195334CR]|uniref:serine/threonine-protein kinase n=1 Tax=Amycolatopsis sp. 195334CR TaxID=2814588 RepID=UPI0035AC0525